MTASWNAAVASLIDAVEEPVFPATLVKTLREVASFDHSVMFAYSGEDRPLDLYDDFSSGRRRVFVTIYQEGPYLLDPFFLACAGGVAPDLYRLRDLAPDRFYQSEYFRSYYVRTGLSEEIGYFLALPGKVMAVVSLMRTDGSPQFSTREFKALRLAHPIVSACARRHWQDLYRNFSPEAAQYGASNIRRSIEHAFHDFGRSVLTPRELEIVEYVLKGNSSPAIGKLLGISAGTVRIHRKNIYAKLGINSQGELFSQFINALAT